MRTTRHTSMHLGSFALAFTAACAQGVGTGDGASVDDETAGDLRIPAAHDEADMPTWGRPHDPCLEPMLICDGACVDAITDPDHCGACGASCADGQSCSDAICNEHVWSESLVATLSSTAEDVALTKDGGIVVVGAFSGTMRLTGPKGTSLGPSDAYVAKLTSDGQLAWLSALAGSGGARALTVDVGPDDHIAVAGTFDGELAVGETVISSIGGEDAFVAVLDPAGGLLWLESFGDVADAATGDITPESQAVQAVAFVDDGDIALAGRFFGSVAIGDRQCSDGRDADMFVARISGDSGALRWSHCTASAGDQIPEDLVTTDGRIVVVGSFTQELALAAASIHVAQEGTEAFIAAYRHDGELDFSHAWLGRGDDAAHAVDVHSATGVLVVAGSFQRDLFLGSITLGTHNERDMFLALVEPTGLPFVVNRYGIWGEQRPNGIDVSDDQIVVAGSFWGATDLGHGKLQATGSSTDAFVGRFDLDLNPIWSHRYGDHHAQSANAVVTTAEGPAFVVGDHDGAIDLGAGALMSVGDRSAFVSHFGL